MLRASFRLAPLAVGVVITTSGAGCAPTPTFPPAPTPSLNVSAAFIQGVDLPTFRGRLEEHAMACLSLGQRDGFDIVQCTIENRQLGSDAEDHSLYSVEIEAVGSGIHRVHATVDQSAEQSTTDDKVLGFFAGTVLGGLVTRDMAPFIRPALNTGGIVDQGALQIVVGGQPSQRSIDVLAREAAPAAT
jgi:hypothetical protein